MNDDNKKSSKKPLWIAVILVVIVAIVVATGFFLLKYYDDDKEVDRIYNHIAQEAGIEDDDEVIFTYTSNSTPLPFNDDNDVRYGLYETFIRLDDLKLKKLVTDNDFVPEEGFSIYDDVRRWAEDSVRAFVDTDSGINNSCITGYRNSDDEGIIRLDVCSGRGQLKTIDDMYNDGIYAAYLNIRVEAMPEGIRKLEEGEELIIKK